MPQCQSERSSRSSKKADCVSIGIFGQSLGLDTASQSAPRAEAELVDALTCAAS
jgi:hypothetical protein